MTLPSKRPRLAVLALVGAAFLPACTVVRVRSADNAPQLRSSGLIDGFLGFGMPEIGDPLEIQVLENGLSVGINLFNLLRLEVGGLGFAFSIGPVQAGLGTLFYEPDPVPYPRDDEHEAEEVEEVEEEGGDAEDEHD